MEYILCSASGMVAIHGFVAIAGIKDDDSVFVLLFLWWSVVLCCVHQMLGHKALQLINYILCLFSVVCKDQRRCGSAAEN